MFAGKKSAQIREILISESAWEEMTCLFSPSLGVIILGQQVHAIFGKQSDAQRQLLDEHFAARK